MQVPIETVLMIYAEKLKEANQEIVMLKAENLELTKAYAEAIDRLSSTVPVEANREKENE